MSSHLHLSTSLTNQPFHVNVDYTMTEYVADSDLHDIVIRYLASYLLNTGAEASRRLQGEWMNSGVPYVQTASRLCSFFVDQSLLMFMFQGYRVHAFNAVVISLLTVRSLL